MIETTEPSAEVSPNIDGHDVSDPIRSAEYRNMKAAIQKGEKFSPEAMQWYTSFGNANSTYVNRIRAQADVILKSELSPYTQKDIHPVDALAMIFALGIAALANTSTKNAEKNRKREDKLKINTDSDIFQRVYGEYLMQTLSGSDLEKAVEKSERILKACANSLTLQSQKRNAILPFLKVSVSKGGAATAALRELTN